jgi:hypothetical protein
LSMWHRNLSVEILLIYIIHQTWPLNSILNRKSQYSAIISELLMWKHLTGYRIQQALLPNKLQIKPIKITVDSANVPLLCTLSCRLCKMFTFRHKPCYSSGSLLLAPQHGGSGSIPGQVMLAV